MAIKHKDANDPCSRVRTRIQFDAKHGRTTSQSVIDFIRRACSCAACDAWRHKGRLAVG